MPKLASDHVKPQCCCEQRHVRHPPPPTGATGRERPPWGAFLKPPLMGMVDYSPWGNRFFVDDARSEDEAVDKPHPVCPDARHRYLHRREHDDFVMWPKILLAPSWFLNPYPTGACCVGKKIF
jgi:hypothetical protein